MSEVFYINDFKVTVTDKSEAYVSFTVHETVSWDMENTPTETELYLECSIKRDSCSHFWFGDEGHLHLCGVDDYKQYIELIEWLYKKAFELMGREPLKGEKWDEGE